MNVVLASAVYTSPPPLLRVNRITIRGAPALDYTLGMRGVYAQAATSKQKQTHAG